MPSPNPFPNPSSPAPSLPAKTLSDPSGPAPSGPAPSGPAPSGPAPSGPAPFGPGPEPTVAARLAAAVAPSANADQDPHLTAPTRLAQFSVRAAAEPATLPRLLELFAKRGVVPARVGMRRSCREQAGRLSHGGEGLVVDIAVAGMDRRLSDYVAACMRAMPCVQAVLTGTSAPGDDAPGDDAPGDDAPGDDTPGDDTLGDEGDAAATGRATT